MPHSYDRKLRVADLLKREIGQLLLQHSQDPRFAFVSLTSVEISKDYAHAKIFVTLLNEKETASTVKALNNAASFFRRELARKVNLRTTPKLHFYYDETLHRGHRISELLK